MQGGCRDQPALLAMTGNPDTHKLPLDVRSWMPWRAGQMAAVRVTARIAVAGRRTPPSASHPPMRVTASTPMTVSANPAEISLGMHGWSSHREWTGAALLSFRKRIT